jgi:hypothetical protein
MNRRFILRIESGGRINFQVVRGYREALGLAHLFLATDRSQQIAVLDATGRVVWQAHIHTAA